MAEATVPNDLPSAALSRPRPGDPAPDVSRAQLLRGVLSAIEVSAEDVTCCAHCGEAHPGRWGKSRRALQRWRCRTCKRSRTAASGTALARVHSLDKLHAVAVDMLSEAPTSCRKLAATLGLNRMTVWRWRKLIAAIWAEAEVALTAAAVCAPPSETVFVRESRKASREWIRHQRDPARYLAPDRLRWIDYRTLELPLPEPMARYRVEVQLAGPLVDEADHRAVHQTCLTSVDTLSRQPEAGPTYSPHGSHRPIVDGSGHTARHARPPRSADSRQPRHLDRVISLVEPFRHFMRPFRGPATRHLQTYRAWFLARLLDPARR